MNELIKKFKNSYANNCQILLTQLKIFGLEGGKFS